MFGRINFRLTGDQVIHRHEENDNYTDKTNKLLNNLRVKAFQLIFVEEKVRKIISTFVPVLF